MRRRTTRALAALLCLTVGGCATVLTFPQPLGGVAFHLDGLTGDDVADPLWFALLPVRLIDLALSVAADIVLLPALVPYEIHRVSAGDAPARERPHAEAPREPEPDTADPPLEPVVEEQASFVWLPETPGDPDVHARHVDGLRRMADAHRDEPLGLALVAHVEERTGDPAGAVELCDRGLALDPGSEPCRLVRGWAHLRLGRLEEADRDLMAVRSASVTPMHQAWARVGQGRVREALGSPDLAALVYREVLATPELRAALSLALPGGVDHAAALQRRLEGLERRD